MQEPDDRRDAELAQQRAAVGRPTPVEVDPAPRARCAPRAPDSAASGCRAPRSRAGRPAASMCPLRAADRKPVADAIDGALDAAPQFQMRPRSRLAGTADAAPVGRIDVGRRRALRGFRTRSAARAPPAPPPSCRRGRRGRSCSTPTRCSGPRAGCRAPPASRGSSATFCGARMVVDHVGVRHVDLVARQDRDRPRGGCRP